MSYQRAQSGPISRPWMLLCVLPYLLLALSNGGAHTHDFSRAPTDSAQGFVMPSRSEAATVSAFHVDSAASNECLACLWTSSACGLVAAPLSFHVLQSPARFGDAISIGVGGEAGSGSSIRGPPFS